MIGRSRKREEVLVTLKLMPLGVSSSQEFNPEAELAVGDNFYNGISISWGCREGCEKHNCEYVCFNVENVNNQEK